MLTCIGLIISSVPDIPPKTTLAPDSPLCLHIWSCGVGAIFLAPIPPKAVATNSFEKVGIADVPSEARTSVYVPLLPLMCVVAVTPPPPPPAPKKAKKKKQ